MSGSDRSVRLARGNTGFRNCNIVSGTNTFQAAAFTTLNALEESTLLRLICSHVKSASAQPCSTQPYQKTRHAMPWTRSKRKERDEQVSDVETNEVKSQRDINSQKMRAQHYKNVIKQIAPEWVCPITAALMTNPVLASDGIFYEREALLKLFETSAPQDAVSPVTREIINRDFIESVAARNTIAKLVASGALDSEMVTEWQARSEQDKQLDNWQKEAEKGNGQSMHSIGLCFFRGTHGLERNENMAFTYFKMASDAKYPPGTTMVATSHLNGTGTKRDLILGAHYLTMASERGSEHACALLGWIHTEGHFGFKKDYKEATEWYKKMKECPYKDSVFFHRKIAAEWLRKSWN